MNDQPIEAPAAPNALPDKSSMVPVSKRAANAIHTGIERVNAATATVRRAEERLQQANQALQAVAATNESYVLAIIEDAGHDPKEFGNFGIWEQDGEYYIRATPQQ